MIISKEFYNRCCPAYQKVVDELEKKLAAIKNREEKIETIMNFSKNYLTPQDYWRLCLNNPPKKISKKHYLEIAERSFFHFFYYKDLEVDVDDFCDSRFPLNIYDDKNLKLIDFPNDTDYGFTVDEHDITYPHNRLKKCVRIFEQNLSHPPPSKLVKRYEEMKQLYPKIKAAQENVEEWFKRLLEVGDDDFVKHNVEYRLSKDFFNVKLWKLYIKFLEEHSDYKRLLQVYSKYCRFFLEDLEMKERYKQGIIKYEPISAQWDNLFEFEIRNDMEETVDNEEDGEDEDDMQIVESDEDNEGEDDNDDDDDMQNSESEDDGEDDTEIDDVESMDEDDDEIQYSKVEMADFTCLNNKICADFYKNDHFQDFDFHQPLLRYIYENANHRVLRKLFYSCKFFFFKKSIPICYRLKSFDERRCQDSPQTSFKDESLTLGHSTNPSFFLRNTYVTGSIDIGYNKYSRSKLLSFLCHHLYRCEAKYISLFGQNLLFNDLKFLIQHECKIKDDYNNYVAFEKIMEYLPNIEELSLPNTKFNGTTLDALSKLKFNSKFSVFYIELIYDGLFDPNELLKFIIANRDDDELDLIIYLNSKFSAKFFEKFEDIFIDYKNSVESYDTVINVFRRS